MADARIGTTGRSAAQDVFTGFERSDRLQLEYMSGLSGSIQMKPWADALHKERRENLGSDSPGTQCLPQGFITVGLTKIVQAPGLIVVLSEDLTYRQIFVDGRELPNDPDPAWMGYSAGDCAPNAYIAWTDLTSGAWPR